MALKDWKKKKEKFVNSEFWRNKKTGGNIYLVNQTGDWKPDDMEYSDEGFYVTSNVDDSYRNGRRYDTHAEAMKATKQLMKTH